ncbi:hypothetical protein D018_3344B, partial [Vibrio parahaemolyticus VP2007-007]
FHCWFDIETLGCWVL